MAARETIVRPLGMITRPNKYGQYPAGALSLALNVCMRDQGVLTSLPALKSYRSNVLGAGYKVRRIFPADDSQTALMIGTKAASANTAAWVSASAATAVSMAAERYTGLSNLSAGKLQATVSRKRMVISTDDSPIVHDIVAQTTTPRAAGFFAPLLGVEVQHDAGSAFLNATVATWCAVWQRTDSDGYEIISEPSNQLRIWNNLGTDVSPKFKFFLSLDNGDDKRAGDIIALYRTRGVQAIDDETDPGETFYLASTHALTADDFTTGYVVIKDSCIDSALGVELYTNPDVPVPDIVGVGGAYINSPPGQSADVFSFKGQTFYNVTKLAPFHEFRPGIYWGLLTTTDQQAHGIGARPYTGTTSLGSPTITGMSSMVGVQVGQQVTGSGFTGTVTVTAVNPGASTVTVDTPASSGGSGPVTLLDMIELNGSSIPMYSPPDFLSALPPTHSILQSDVAIYYGRLGAPGILAEVSSPQIVLRARRYANGDITIRATNGDLYDPPLPSYTDTARSGKTDPRGNRLQWSKPQQPEHVPPLQELLYGNGTHLRGMPARDCVWLFATDGLFRMSGQQDNWRVDPVDLTLALAARNAVAVMEDTVYAYTNRGLVAIESSGAVMHLSRDSVGDVLPGAAYSDTWDSWVSTDELHREAFVASYDENADQTTCFVHNVATQGEQKSFTKIVEGAWTATAYARYLQSLLIAKNGSQPSAFTFELDTSNTRMSGAELRFQPLLLDNSAFTQKQFIDADLIFEGVSVADMTVQPQFNGANTVTACTVKQSSSESRGRFGVPRAYAIATTLKPGFTVTAHGTDQAWSFRGMSLRGVVLSSQSGRR